MLGLIGESGAGKSTIGLSAMAYGRGGVRITGGEIVLNGQRHPQARPRGAAPAARQEVTYVAQSAAAAFNPASKLMDQVIETTLAHAACPGPRPRSGRSTLFRKLGLPDPETIGNRYPHQVSGGQLQRAMTAMALCPQPDLVIFDEPTTALDVTTQIDVLAAIKEAIARHRRRRALHHPRPGRGGAGQRRDHGAAQRQDGGIRHHRADHQRPARGLYPRRWSRSGQIEHEEKPPAREPVLTVEGVTARYSRHRSSTC